MAHYIGKDCVKCGACKEACPVEAIYEGSSRFVVNSDLCVDCGSCEGVCPVNAFIDPMEEDLTMEVGGQSVTFVPIDE